MTTTVAEDFLMCFSRIISSVTLLALESHNMEHQCYIINGCQNVACLAGTENCTIAVFFLSA